MGSADWVTTSGTPSARTMPSDSLTLTLAMRSALPSALGFRPCEYLDRQAKGDPAVRQHVRLRIDVQRRVAVCRARHLGPQAAPLLVARGHHDGLGHRWRPRPLVGERDLDADVRTLAGNPTRRRVGHDRPRRALRRRRLALLGRECGHEGQGRHHEAGCNPRVSHLKSPAPPSRRESVNGNSSITTGGTAASAAVPRATGWMSAWPTSPGVARAGVSNAGSA